MTIEEKIFFDHHKIPVSLAFDAKGSNISKGLKDEMKLQQKGFSYNANSCKIIGHSVTTAAGHCAQCNTANVAFQKRSMYFGYVYIAGSILGNVIKIGSSENIGSRGDSLNKTSYGGFSDWIILFHMQCNKMGTHESYISNELKTYAVRGQYQHDQHSQIGKEMFRCSYFKAAQVILSMQEKYPLQFFSIWKNSSNLLEKYNFKNLAKKM
jgi:hypothetical protein